MRPGARPVFLLPPRPRGTDWLLAAISAGFCLGAAEVGVAALLGPPMAPTWAVAVVAADAAWLGIFGAVAAAALWLRRRLGATERLGAPSRLSYSQLVGFLAGVLPAAALLGASFAVAPPVAAWKVAVSAPIGLALALGAGVAAARIADATERVGVPASGPLCWGAVAVLLALTTRALSPPSGAGSWAGLVIGAALLAAAVPAAFVRARLRGSRPRASFARLAWLSGVVAGVLALSPHLLPWLVADAGPPDLGRGPANLLLVALGDAAEGRDEEAIDLIGWGGIVYETHTLPGRTSLDDLLVPTGDVALAREFEARGFAVGAASLVPDGWSRVGFEPAEVRAGGRALLEGSGRWMTGANLLAGFDGLGSRRAGSSAAGITAAARDWLLEWRSRRAPAPFFLLVDLRGSGGSGKAAPVSRLLETLEQLEVAQRTLVVLWWPGRSRGTEILAVRPPASWPQPSDRYVASRSIRPIELRQTLQLLAASEFDHPLPLPALLSRPATRSP